MSSTVLYMSMSLDGFIAGPNESPNNGLGDGGHRLHEWVFQGGEDDFDAAVARLRGVNRQIYDESTSTGAVVAGRGTFEPARSWGGNHHDGVPIYILSRNPAPAWAAQWPAVHYVSDLQAAARERSAASRHLTRVIRHHRLVQRGACSASPHGLPSEIAGDVDDDRPSPAR
ncbi:MAG: dihydrofolate reductase family protein [Acidimicrobiales bacterium]